MALARELGEVAEGVMISQVVPFPWDNSIPLVAEYQTALKAADAHAEVGFVSLEGYMVGRLVIQALEKAPGKLTRQAFLDGIASTGPCRDEPRPRRPAKRDCWHTWP